MQTPEGHEVVYWDGYEAVYHPGVHRRITMHSPDGLDLPLYVQEDIHLLNHHEPPRRYHVGLSGGRHGQDFSMLIEDPRGRIVSVTVEVRKETAEWGGTPASDEGNVEVVHFITGAVTCPPFCNE